MKYLIFNLKSKLTYLDIIEYAANLTKIKNDIIVSPSNIYLEYFHSLNFNTCAQDVSIYNEGNYTGEVNAKQLKSIGCKYVIVGHYERRNYFEESSSDLIAKINNALDNDLKVIYCVCSSINDDFNIIKVQIKEVFDNIKNLDDIIIAYEPIDLIGAHSELNDIIINERLKSIKEFILDEYNKSIELIYGGSVNKDNIESIKKITSDGFIVGDASTDIDEVFTLYNELKQDSTNFYTS